ncbi:MAG: hypothetical protein JRI68_11875 [Deltaproteobacteria bacterium]|nr:hypothetical protein [Deltaproteobacteria bacterium]
MASRLPLLAVVALVAVILRLAAQAPAERTLEGVAELLGAAVDGTVAADEFVWEPSEGRLVDVLFGRNVLFLAETEAAGPRDLYRARVRVSREGRPLAVRSTTNLTHTPLGDEALLVARNRYVAFATQAFNRVQGVTVIDLDGAARPNLGWARRLIWAIDNYRSVGTLRGLARREVVFGAPPSSAQIELQGHQLVLALGDPPQPASLDLVAGKLNPGSDDRFDIQSWAAPAWAKRLPEALCAQLRAQGDEAAADRLLASLATASHRLARWSNGSSRSRAAAEPQAAADGPATRWPPANIPSRFAQPLEGEGQWRPPQLDWLPKPTAAIGEPEPYLVETVIRPDPDRPDADVRLVAIDTRQLELRIEAGFEVPRPQSGPRGRGAIPPGDRSRVVAAFNGAFQRLEPDAGIVVNRRVLVPPQPHRATVAVDVWGRTHLGSWGDRSQLPRDVVSVRQHLDLLVEDGDINPHERERWGFPPEGGDFATERSALCRTGAGLLVYGWGRQVTSTTLAEALLLAGCQDALHLDMSPGHGGFSYLNAQTDPVRSHLLDPSMTIRSDRFVQASPRDFFYLVVGDPTPRSAGSLSWKPAEGAHPPPAWLPAIHVAEVDKLGARTRLTAFAADRFAWEIRPGKRERAGRTAQGPLAPAELAQTLAAVGLGVGFRKRNRRGLVLDGVATLPIRPHLGMLDTGGPGAGLSIARSLEDMALPADATELVIVAENGQLRSEARTMGARRPRSLACLLPPSTLLVAEATFDSLEAATEVLLEAGCRRVVSLNRGKQVGAFVHLAGSKTPPRERYDDTVLYGLVQPMRGMALRLVP